MKAYFLNISEEEKNSIKEKHSKPYDGYVTRGNNVPNETPLTVGNYALDTEGVTVSNKGDVTEYKNKDINMKLKKTCNECGGLYEGTMCECGTKMYEEKEECDECGTEKYTMEDIEESIKLKSKAPLVSEQISESLSWFKKLI